MRMGDVNGMEVCSNDGPWLLLIHYRAVKTLVAFLE